MALITCPECGNAVSDKATSCIHCGFPISAYINSEPQPEVEDNFTPYTPRRSSSSPKHIQKPSHSKAAISADTRISKTSKKKTSIIVIVLVFAVILAIVISLVSTIRHVNEEKRKMAYSLLEAAGYDTSQLSDNTDYTVAPETTSSSSAVDVECFERAQTWLNSYRSGDQNSDAITLVLDSPIFTGYDLTYISTFDYFAPRSPITFASYLRYIMESTSCNYYGNSIYKGDGIYNVVLSFIPDDGSFLLALEFEVYPELDLFSYRSVVLYRHGVRLFTTSLDDSLFGEYDSLYAQKGTENAYLWLIATANAALADFDPNAQYFVNAK